MPAEFDNKLLIWSVGTPYMRDVRCNHFRTVAKLTTRYFFILALVITVDEFQKLWYKSDVKVLASEPANSFAQVFC